MATGIWAKLLACDVNPDEVWQIGIADLGAALGIEPDEPGPPPLFLCQSITSDHVHGRPLTLDHGPMLEQMAEILHEFADQLPSPGRPARLECNDRKLTGDLNQRLKGSGTEVHFQAEMPIWEGLIEEFADQLEKCQSLLPSLREAGCSDRQVADFAAAAAAYRRAEWWQLLDDVDLIQIESPKPPKFMKYAVILGAAGEKFGLGLYDSPEDHHALMSGRIDPLQLNLFSLTFEDPADVASGDVNLWEELALPEEPDDAFPEVNVFSPSGPRRPTPKELDFLTLILWGLAQSTEEELDSGRWTTTVEIQGRPQACVFSVPNLLNPPDRAEWLRRGQMPDNRSHELQFDQIREFMEGAGQGMSIEELNRKINQQFTGPPPEPAELPRNTAAERAVAYYQEALESFGRRRLLLARQALSEDPNHADARILLAESTHSPHQRVEIFREAQAIAAAALGSEMQELAGQFWGFQQTRPYMRATHGLAAALREAGRVHEATEHYGEMLRLNPDDNQGVRYEFVTMLLAEDENDRAWTVLNAYPEQTTGWLHLKAVAEYQRSGGGSTAARKALRDALQANRHVVPLLKSNEFPPESNSYAPGSFEEGAVCVIELSELWDGTKGYLPWLRQEHETWQQERSNARHRPDRRSPGKTGKSSKSGKPGKPKRR
ncbi:MAG: hypothetical protein U0795_04760 [Pirellulales bacterium]